MAEGDYCWGAWFRGGPTAPLEVRVLDMDYALQGNIGGSARKFWLFPIRVGKRFAMANVEHSYRNMSPQVAILNEIQAELTSRAVDAAYSLKDRVMKQYNIGILECSELSTTAVWLHNRDDQIFFEIAATGNKPTAVPMADFAAEIMQRASAKLALRDRGSRLSKEA